MTCDGTKMNFNGELSIPKELAEVALKKKKKKKRKKKHMLQAEKKISTSFQTA